MEEILIYKIDVLDILKESDYNNTCILKENLLKKILRHNKGSCHFTIFHR